MTARKLNRGPTLPLPLPGGSPTCTSPSSEAFPSSFNHGFDTLILDLIREHRRVVLQSERALNGIAPKSTSPVKRGMAEVCTTSDVDDFPIAWPEGLEGPQEATAGVAPDAVEDLTSAGGKDSCPKSENCASAGGEDPLLHTAVKDEFPQLATPVAVTVARLEDYTGIQTMASTPDAPHQGELGIPASRALVPRMVASELVHLEECRRLSDEEAAAPAPCPSDQDRGIASKVRRQIRRLVRCESFEVFICSAILLNAVIIGVETDLAATNLDHEPGMAAVAMQSGFNCLFLAELCCRVIADGRSFFYRGSDLGWNLLDTSTCVLSVVMEVLTALSESRLKAQWSPSSLRVARGLRTVRILRIARTSKLLRFTDTLRLLIFSVLSTLRSLMWAMLLLLGIFFLFATLLTQAVTTYRIESTAQDMLDEAIKFWGSLATSMFTLFMSISGGVSWIEAVAPLQEVGHGYVFVFVFFIAMTYFAALNVITGVFCENAHQCALADQHRALLVLQENERAHYKTLERLFRTCDDDHSGVVSLAEFEAHIKDDAVRACFDSIGLDISDAIETFRSLDIDHSGGIHLSELIKGASKLRGTAKGIDIFQVKHDVKRLREDIRTLGHAVGALFSQQDS